MLKKMQLKNGLDVFLYKSTKSPVVSVRMWVKTGSADEQKGEEGISHFIEHLVFKGSRNLGVGDAAKKIEGAGGQLNAYTSFDETVFHVTLYKEQFEVGLEVISEMLGYPSFDKEEIDNEREVVIEEIKRSMDNPGRQSSRLLFSSMYKKHPYGVPVIGYEKNIENVSVEEIRDYFERRYVPENMFLVVSGDFELVEAKKLIKKYYGDIPANKLEKVKRTKEPKPTKAKATSVQSTFKQNIVHFSWPIPKISHKDIAALDMLSMVLGQSESSLLNQKMRLEKSLVRYAYSSIFTTRDNGFFNISLSVDKDKIEEAMTELLGCFQAFFAKPLDQDLLEISKLGLESDEIYTYETVDGISKQIGYYEFNFSDPDYSKKYLEKIRELTQKEIFKSFKKYLKPELINLTIFSEEDEKITKKIMSSWLRKYRKKFPELKAPSSEKIKTRKSHKMKGLKKNAKTSEKLHLLPSGVRVYIRQSDEVPIVNIRTAFLGGMRIEKEEDGGLSELTTQCWTKETELMSEKELSKFVELRSSGISSFCGKNTNGLSMTSLSPYWQDMFDVYMQNLSTPKFSQALIDREKHFLTQALRQRCDNPAQEAVLGFMGKMFKNHPYGRSSLGTEPSLKKLGEEQVNYFYKNILKSKKVSICISGDIKNIDGVLDKIESSFQEIKRPDDRLKKIKLDKITTDQFYFKKSDKEQTHLLVGQRGLTIQDPQRYILDVMQAILAGQGGRLFMELRDKNSMAYSLSPMRIDGLDGGFFGAYIACSPEKASKALEMLDIEFEKLCEKEVPLSEMERAKKYIIGKYHIDLQKNSAMTSSVLFNDIYGIDLKEVFTYHQKINAVSTKDIKKLARKLFHQNKVFSAVGQTQPW